MGSLRWLGCALVAACGNAASAPPPPTPAPASPPPAAKCVGIPAAACTTPGLHAYRPGDRDRVGEWRYAVIAAPYDPAQDVTLDELRARWRDGSFAASAETVAALTPLLGASTKVAPLAAHPMLDAQHRAIVPAHELTPHWSVVTVAGEHPLAHQATQLVVPICGSAPASVRNINPDRMTTLVMSGTTALTRRLADRMDKRGLLYPVKLVKPWFASADLVHISNETSFVRTCDPLEGKTELTFCSRVEYIKLLEELETDIVELTGSHLHDYGRQWIHRTIDMYEKRGWVWFGGGRTQLEATEPRIVEHAGNKLAFLGCNEVGTRLHALTPGAGVAGCDWERMAWQIADLRRRGIVPIVSIQHDEVYTHVPPKGLVRDLRRMAAAGAEFVMGSQAHTAHPWEMHRGAYVHYGPGNIFFDQRRSMTLEATTDKLHVHAGKLLTVEHLYTTFDHSRPRPLDAAERALFLTELADAERHLDGAEPWAAATPVAETRTRPDSFVIAHGRSQLLSVTVPAKLDPGVRYKVVLDLEGTAPPSPDAFVIVPRGKLVADKQSILAFARSKYPVADATINEPLAKERHRHHHHRR